MDFSRLSKLATALLMLSGIGQTKTITFYSTTDCAPGMTMAYPNAIIARCYSAPALLPPSVLFSALAPTDIGPAYERRGTNRCNTIIDSAVGLDACVTSFVIDGAKIITCNANVAGMLGQLCGISKRDEGNATLSAIGDGETGEEEEECEEGSRENAKMGIDGHWFRMDDEVPMDAQNAMIEMFNSGTNPSYESLPASVLAQEDFDYVPEK